MTKIIYGEPKSGKTYFCSGDKHSLFFATEPGQQFTKATVIEIMPGEPLKKFNEKLVKLGKPAIKLPWEIFQHTVRELYQLRNNKAGDQLKKMGYKTVYLDIVDNLYTHCLDWVCAKKGIEYPPENDFGKTWKEVRTEWEVWMARLFDLVNVSFLSHATTVKKEVRTSSGMLKEIDFIQPTFKGNKAAQYLDGIVNCIGYIRKTADGKYVITFKGEPGLATGDRSGILESLGDMPNDFMTVAKLYQAKCKELGYEVASRW